jgi:hypothetical protein
MDFQLSWIPATATKLRNSYQFSTEMHPQDLRLQIMAILTSEKGAFFSMNAFNETVSIVEPDASIFDPQMFV